MGDHKFGEPWTIVYKSDTFDGILIDAIICPDGSDWDEIGIQERAVECINAFAGIENPEKEIAEKDAEIERLKEIIEDKKEVILDSINNEVEYKKLAEDWCQQIATLKLALDHANDEVERLSGLINKLNLIQVEATKVCCDSGQPVIVNDGFVLVDKNSLNREKEITNLLKKMAEMSKDNAALRAVLKKHEYRGRGKRCLECAAPYDRHAPGCEIDRLPRGEKE